jgi:hypothetical protein
MLNKIDAFFLDRYQKFAHRFQRLTGKTNFWIAAKLRLLIATRFALEIILTVYHIDPRWLHHFDIQPFRSGWELWFYFCSGAFILRHGLFCWRTQEAEAFRRLERGLGNDLRVNPITRFLRFAFLLCIPLWVADLFFGVMSISLPLFLSIMYLEACDPLPPCRGKIREWIEAMGFAPAPCNC